MLVGPAPEALFVAQRSLSTLNPAFTEQPAQMSAPSWRGFAVLELRCPEGLPELGTVGAGNEASLSFN